MDEHARREAARRFWSEPFAPRCSADMAAKYTALRRLEPGSAPGGPKSPGRPDRAALRACAERWPGSLREAELVAPARIRERRAWADEGGRVGAEPRAQWRARGQEAVPLWSRAHALLADVRAVRRRRRTTGIPVEALAAWSRETKPTVELAAWLGPVLRARTAYWWLAFETGLALPELFGSLFDRAGHWDRRPEDPPWAHRSLDA